MMENFKQWLEGEEYDFSHVTSTKFRELGVLCDFIEDNQQQVKPVADFFRAVAKIARTFKSRSRKSIGKSSSYDKPPLERGEEIYDALLHRLLEIAQEAEAVAKKLTNEAGDDAKLIFFDGVEFLQDIIKHANSYAIEKSLVGQSIKNEIMEFFQVFEASFNRIAAVVSNWGTVGRPSASRGGVPRAGEKITVFDSRFGGKEPLVGTAELPRDGQAVYVRYDDNRQEQLTGVHFNDRQRLKYNRLLHRWEFR